MAVEIKVNENGSLTFKDVTSEELQMFTKFFGNPIDDKENPINRKNQQYQDHAIIDGKKCAYSVYDAPNNGKDSYTIDIQMMN